MVASIRMLLYGESGTGKTTFAATFPGPIRWLICSGGDKPGELKSIDTPENRKKIHPVIITDFEQFLEVIRDGNEYATTVLDHASGFADMVLSKIIGKPIPAQKGWGLASMQHYGQMALQCKEAFREILNLPGNVIIIAQQRTFGGKDDGMDPDLIKPTIGAALSPSIVGWLNPACDYVIQMFKRGRTITRTSTVAGKQVSHLERAKGVDWCARCEPHDVYTTKFRLHRDHKLPEFIIDPNYDKLLKVISGSK